MTRRRWLAGAAGLAATGIGLDALVVEPRRVTTTQHRLGAGGGPTLRIVQLSDLHLRRAGSHEERIAAAVTELRPGLVVITGDAIDRADALGPLDHFLSMLALQVPLLAILGNWEHWGAVDLRALQRLYGRWNGELLRNRSVRLPVAGTELLVTGLDDLIGGAPDVQAALAGTRPCANHLLLAHCPLHRDRFRSAAQSRAPMPGMADRTVDPALLAPQLMLAGHTHGGQIAPFGVAAFRPQGSGRYVRGWYRDDSTALYVSRGIGTSVVPARLGAPPEVASFEWTLTAP